MEKELQPPPVLRRGHRGADVRRIQEWLCLNGWSLRVDGGFGPATETAVRGFQAGAGLPVSGAADPRTFAALVAPMTGALRPIAPAGRSFRALVAAVAQRHLAARPREAGGRNRGPWVRLYTRGRQGDRWPWCAAFVSFVIRQAAECLAVSAPLRYTCSCDVLAAEGSATGLLVAGVRIADRAAIPAGSVFLTRRAPGDWAHAGIVTAAAADWFESIEGNTNDSGSRDGDAVLRRYRGYRRQDFIVFPAGADG
ncbi:MAG TPA: peptidoglycan-binding domain-containing protein [Acidobacteriota bacterium]|nr:peptidoglycan-binding domain-containing protein [Acidobacteriota bacterium]HQF86068.1 peptidoglycan-binding domain-containing protein [Acidobacteriota bacterium]HQG90689.1 peptidoglycan-binding domain-containing protein [Acidobacteriota bacterium]HQK87131.1 peptidoglycan-binding domain-containing protein [Acidobacteriota bacterium]